MSDSILGMAPRMTPILCPPDQQDAMTEMLLDTTDCVGVKRLADGSYALLTVRKGSIDIRLGATRSSWASRYSFEDLGDCLRAWEPLQSRDDVPAGGAPCRPQLVKG